MINCDKKKKEKPGRVRRRWSNKTSGHWGRYRVRVLQRVRLTRHENIRIIDVLSNRAAMTCQMYAKLK